MATTTGGYEWSHSSPHRSTDTVSPIYPERPIRPLPKRRLRNKLSPEQANSIIYPPTPPAQPPLFTFPYSQLDKTPSLATRHNGPCTCEISHRTESDEEFEDGEAVPHSPSLPYSRIAARNGGQGGGFSQPESTASSADGYESFENTNNKKKRKIPNMGSSNGLSLSAELASMGISTSRDGGATDDDGVGSGQYYQSGLPVQSPGSGTGISGAGRGRYGRSTGRASVERRPLGSSTNAINAYPSPKSRRDVTGDAGKDNQSEQGGIISNAIAKANAEANNREDNKFGLLEHLEQQLLKTPAPKTQFTFTCGSDSANKMVWPGQGGTYVSDSPVHQANKPWTSSTAPSLPHPPTQPPAPTNGVRRSKVSTHGTQTSPNMEDTQPGVQSGQPPPGQAAPNGDQAQQQPRKPRRRPSKEYALAARQRRMQQEYQNYHHPPRREDIWICEFCEYESIFGEPPVALIRQYEIKDRKERKRLAEKRRLLEKARMKGRKGKKATKNAAKNANSSQQGQAASGGQGYDGQQDTVQGDPQGEEYIDDEYDDVPPPAPTPSDHHGLSSKAVANGDYGHNHRPNGNGHPPPATTNGKGFGPVNGTSAVANAA